MEREDAVYFFSDLYGGRHHIPAKIKPYGPDGYSVNHYGELTTFDFDLLTKLVFLAHDYCYRAGVMQGGPGSIKIVIWKRTKRDGSFWEKHPTIETALEHHRELF